MPDANQTLNLLIKASSKEAKSAFKDIGLSISAVIGALYAGQKAYEKFVAPVIEYNKEIKDASESTGMAADQLSRFIQVGDDMGVSMASITRALELGTKNGFAPTIDSLADLADQGNAMGSPTERAALYTKLFGRQWAELNPILQLGGRRIRELAAAQADGLVVTYDEIHKTEELRQRLDSLADSYTALRNEIVLNVVPVVDLNFRATELTAKWAEMQEEMTGLKPTFLEWRSQWHLIEEAIRGADGVVETGIVHIGLMADATRDATGALEDLAGEAPWTAAAMAAMSSDPAVRATVDTLVEIAREADRAARALRRMQELLQFQFTPEQRQESGKRTGTHPGGGGEQEGYASGGQLTGAGSYLVGEHGAERFTPGTGGTVSPANDPLVRAINHMVRSLPVILRDAVQKA